MNRSFFWELARNICVGGVIVCLLVMVRLGGGWSELSSEAYYHGAQNLSRYWQEYVRWLQVVGTIAAVFAALAVLCHRRHRKADLREWREHLPDDPTVGRS